MPVSVSGTKMPTLSILKRFKATKILELGVGYGHFGKLITDSIENSEIFGIEIFKPYFEKIPQHCYRELFNEDMRFFDYENFIQKQQIDAIIAIDSIEHLYRDDGIKLLKKLEELFPLIIVSVPIVEFKQGPQGGNDWEEHKTQWEVQEILDLGYSLEHKDKTIGVFFKQKEM